jgi:anti-repressor protein
MLNPWFVAKDVCDVFNLQARDVLKVLDSDEISYVDRIHLGLGPVITMIIINESGLYSLPQKPLA